jgi:hypothetical protein
MSELPNPVGTVYDPNLKSLLEQVKRDVLTTINCSQVGEIVSFDAAKQTAKVQLKIMRLIADRTSSPIVYIPKICPLLIDCPVMILSGGNGRLTFPIAAGDPCLVVFNDRDIDNWFATGATLPPNSTRLHDLSDGLAIVGFRNQANAITDYNTDDAELRFAGGVLKVNDKIALDGAVAGLKSTLQKIIDALTRLDLKTGPSAATQIAAAQTEADAFLQ